MQEPVLEKEKRQNYTSALENEEVPERTISQSHLSVHKWEKSGSGTHISSRLSSKDMADPLRRGSSTAKMLQVHDVEKWCQAHPQEFDKLVVRFASVEGIRHWNEAHPLPPTLKIPSKQPYVKCISELSMPDLSELAMVIDPVAERRVSEMVHSSLRLNKPHFQPLVTIASVVTMEPTISQPRAVEDHQANNKVRGMSNEKKFLFLLKEIGTVLDTTEAAQKITQLLPTMINTCSCSMFLTDVVHNKLVMMTDGHANKLFESDQGFVGRVLQSKKILRLTQPALDPQYEPAMASTVEPVVFLMSIPLITSQGDGIGVIEFVRTAANPQDFSEDDESLMQSCIEYCCIAIRNSQMFEQAVVECQWSGVLLTLAKSIFEQLDNLDDMITKIIVNAAVLMSCERCSLFMVDRESKELYARVFDVSPDNSSESDTPVKLKEIRFPMDVGIAGHVATTGEVLNISDAYADERFHKGVDAKTGYVTRTILCMPIYSPNEDIIGVAQLVNKKTGTFSARDERLFEAFAVYCGLGIHAVRMYEQTNKAAARAQVAIEVLSYHVRASAQDVEVLNNAVVPTCSDFNLDRLGLDVADVGADKVLVACVRMFYECGFVTAFRIPHKPLCQWLLSVRKNYRDVTYHNWDHAFSVTQSMFAMQQSGDMFRFLNTTERMAMLVACLCHDLDHRGTNNAFEGLNQSQLSKLYSTSTMERHHFDQCVMILNQDGNNFLTNLPADEYRSFMVLVETAILATDLAENFRMRKTIKELIDTKQFNWKIEKHKVMMVSMLMTGADLSAITRPWDAQRRTAEVVYAEFYEQGDKELKIMGKHSQDMFNRAKICELPKMQLGFIDFVCLPVYEMIANVLPGLQGLVDSVKANRHEWEVLSHQEFRMSIIAPTNPILPTVAALVGKRAVGAGGPIKSAACSIM